MIVPSKPERNTLEKMAVCKSTRTYEIEDLPLPISIQINPAPGFHFFSHGGVASVQSTRREVFSSGVPVLSSAFSKSSSIRVNEEKKFIIARFDRQKASRSWRMDRAQPKEVDEPKNMRFKEED